MVGFNLVVGNLDLPLRDAESCNIEGRVQRDKFKFEYSFLNKFKDDKIVFEDENYCILLDGIVLNKKELLDNNKKKDFGALVLHLIESEGDVFFNNFRGSFSGFFYNKNTDEWIIFSDHIGSKHIYYSINSDGIIIGTNMKRMYDTLRANNIKYQLDENAAYMLLSFGYMLDDYTLCSSVKKVKPGHYLVIRKDKSISLKQYYSLPKQKNNTISEQEAIEEIDSLFRKAIKLQFEKDLEYGYKHFVALSGGLDSRMTSWVAHEMGYTNQLNFTFSQSNYLDETIAKQIASDLKHEWIFKSLDNGLFLKDIDDITNISGGNVLYYGLAHGNSLMKYLNYNILGVLHSGLLGDILKGSYLNKKGYGEFSSKLVNKVIFSYKNESKESFITRQRAFNGIHNSLVLTNHYSESFSPFYNLDLLDFTFSLSERIRLNSLIYKKWMINKYPKASLYKWDSINARISSPKVIIKGREIPLNQVLPIILRKFKLSKPASSTKNHMNPLDYWYNTNKDIKMFQDQYFNDNIQKLDGFWELQKDCKDLYFNGNAVEQNQVLTLLSGLKLFF